MKQLITIVQFDAYYDKQYLPGDITTEIDATKTKLIYTSQNFIISNGFTLLDTTTITDNVIAGICETANYIYKYQTEIDKRAALQSMNVDNYKIDKLSEKFTGAGMMLPYSITVLLSSLKKYQSTFSQVVTRT